MPIASGPLAAVEQIAEGNVRYVTPSNPLIINDVAPTFDDVVIQGGDIQTVTKVSVTFKQLRKDS